MSAATRNPPSQLQVIGRYMQVIQMVALCVPVNLGESQIESVNGNVHLLERGENSSQSVSVDACSTPFSWVLNVLLKGGSNSG